MMYSLIRVWLKCQNINLILYIVWPKSRIPAVYLFIFMKNLLYHYWLSRTELVPAYVRLLRDNEAEVRIAAAGKVTKFCKILNPELAIQHILPCVKV